MWVLGRRELRPEAGSWCLSGAARVATSPELLRWGSCLSLASRQTHFLLGVTEWPQVYRGPIFPAHPRP